jgi:hypothetical protein
MRNQFLKRMTRIIVFLPVLDVAMPGNTHFRELKVSSEHSDAMGYTGVTTMRQFIAASCLVCASLLQ